MTMQIGKHQIGDAHPTYVIAEAGSNHNRDLDLAFRLIDSAAACGVDAVKFQTFRAETLYARSSSSVAYLARLGITTPIFDIIAACEMPVEWIPWLAERCGERGVDFMSTPFDERSAELLAPHVPAFKVASYELTHLPLINHIATLGKPMILSTGAATTEEIDDAVRLVRSTPAPSLALMQCTARYPAEPDRMNLLAIAAMKARYNVPVGLSDHSRDPLAAPAATVAVGGRLIEKHFTLDRQLPGPDHSFAIEPGELAMMVEIIRNVERMLGDGVKRPLDVEAELVNFRRSIYTVRTITAGTSITRDDVAILRRSGEPAPDVRPVDIDELVGRRVVRDLPPQWLLSWADVEPR